MGTSKNLLRRLGVTSTTRRSVRRIGLPASAWDLRLLGRPLGTAVAARSPNLTTPFPEHSAYLRRVLRGGAAWFLLVVCLVAIAVVFVPVVGIVMGVVVAALVAAVAVWSHLPERSHPTLPVRAGHPTAPLICPRYHRERAEIDGPVFACSNGTRPVVFVTDLELGARTLADHRDELATVALPYDELIPGHFIRFMAPQDHQRYRRLLAAAFQPSTIAALEPMLAGETRSWLASLSADSLRAVPPGVEPETALRPLVLRTWYRVTFGFSPDDDEWRTIERCHDVVDSRHTVSGRPADHAAIAELEELVVGHLRHVEPGPSAFDVLRERDPAAADDSTLVRNLIVLAWTSSADTTGLLVWLLKRLTDDHVWLERLREALGTPGAADLADRIVDETLRLGQSEVLIREVTAPVMIGEHEVPPGWHLRIGLREAHRDADLFDDPDRFDPDRFARGRFGRLEFAPFGLDHHQCVGEALVRTTARQFVLALADGYRCAGRDDGPDQVSSWRHWHPNAAWRLVIDPIGRAEVTAAAVSTR